MGLLERLTGIVASGSPQGPPDDPFHGLYRGFYPPEWVAGYSAAGVMVTPELALTLSAIWSGVTRIAGDFARMPVHIFRVRDDGGKERVRGGPSSPGIEGLAYRLRWKPNAVQTAAEFFGCLAAQFVMRSRAYAEIIPSPTTAMAQLVPRHPDRVIEERTATGRLLFKIVDPGGGVRTLTQDEMLYLHDTRAGGFASLTRMQYGAQAIGTALSAEQAAGRFFKSGMTAAVVATHKTGAMEDEERAAFHRDLTRFATGARNNFGLLLVEEDIDIKTLGIDPQKAQMMDARNFGVREAARLLHMPPELLFADNSGTQTGRTWEEIVNVYHTGCLAPIATFLEQAMQDALVVDKDQYIVEFLMDALYRGDLGSRADYYQAALQGPWMWPDEIRIKEGLNPDDELKEIFRKRYRPADAKPASGAPSPRGRAAADPAGYRYHLLLHDAALRIVRRERAAVEKMARKHAQNPEGWRAELRRFYTDHAPFVAQTLRISPQRASAYCAAHEQALAARGVAAIDEHWERMEAETLVGLAADAHADETA